MPSEHIMFSTVTERFGWNLRIARQRAGLTQRGLAERMGRSQSRIAEWESAKCLPRTMAIVRLAEALDIEPGELLRETRGLSS
ncbi:MAG TPA: helix-turn-helix transcriptional regulator [Solirubrobacterales bacterium]|nr:helix-turn-helix transcriptional regulator [Solirubrobacterales bacterium]